MKLAFFEIENFRSIINKTRCDVDSLITVLAGKNESGKSNILKALYSFSTGEFDDTDIPEGRSELPKIKVQYTIDVDELTELARESLNMADQDEFETKLPKKTYNVTFTKKFGETLKVGGEAYQALLALKEGEERYWSSKCNETLKEIQSAEVIKKNRDQIKSDIKQDGPSWLKALGDLVVSLTDDTSADKISDYKKELEDCQKRLNFYARDINLHSPLWKIAPKFILFDSFEDILPSQADEADVKEKEILKRFFALSGIDPGEIFEEEEPKKRKLIVNKVSNEVSGDFCGYYQQSDVKLKLDVDGDTLQFYVYDEEGSIPFYLNQRSKGFQWFLSFYLTLKSVGSEGKHIILIDEPGLYLHAKAQQDMMNILGNLSVKHQIIFSTHSPYLIDPDHLNRVRLVMRDSVTESTIVENKVQKVSDKETLTPIVTAIGYDLSQGLTVGRQTNVITEGISDYYYLKAFLKLLCPDSIKDIGIIPAVGADQVPNIASILLGWGVKSVALFDNDAQGRANHTKLVKNFGFINGVDAFFVSPNKGDAIEDIFTCNDFYKWILKEAIPDTPVVKKNSDLSKNRKVTLAKTFYENVNNGNIRLSKDTLESAAKLLRNLGVLIEETATA